MTSCRAFQLKEGKCTLFDLHDLPSQIVVNLNLNPNLWIKDAKDFMQLKRQVKQKPQKLRLFLVHKK